MNAFFYDYVTQVNGVTDFQMFIHSGLIPNCSSIQSCRAATTLDQPGLEQYLAKREELPTRRRPGACT